MISIHVWLLLANLGQITLYIIDVYISELTASGAEKLAICLMYAHLRQFKSLGFSGAAQESHLMAEKIRKLA